MADGWGSGPWGGSPWGGGASPTDVVVGSALAVRENIFRIVFSVPIRFTGLLDAGDASDPSNYAVAPVAGTTGLDGTEARPLTVVEARLAGVEDGVLASMVGTVLDLVTDRPMTPWGALYDLTLTVIAADLASYVGGTFRTPGVFRRLEPPSVQMGRPTRDFANPQTLSAARAGLSDAMDPGLLGTLRVDDSGDYAFDEGDVSLRKRVVRRLTSSVGGFAHLPGYGVGIPDHAKRLAISAVVADLSARAESQIALEPEVAQVRVRAVADPNLPGLVRFQAFVRTKQGTPQRFDVPFVTG